MTTLNYTTTVPASRTIGEMGEMLAKAGAASIATQYDAGKPVGLQFTLNTEFGLKTFALPVDVHAAHRLLQELDAAKKLPHAAQRAKGYYSTPQQAERVAWRVMKDWLEAQLALLQYRMVALDQVMLPYLVGGDGKTLYEAYKDNQRALTTGANS
jgi:hypothetical protein